MFGFGIVDLFLDYKKVFMFFLIFIGINCICVYFIRNIEFNIIYYISCRFNFVFLFDYLVI